MMNGNKRNRQRDRHHLSLPKGYLEGGYFKDGYVKESLLTDAASLIAENFGKANPKMTNSQLRRVYTHVKTLDKRYFYTKDEKEFIKSIKAIDSFVAEAKGKGNVPKIFYDFINKNIAT